MWERFTVFGTVGLAYVTSSLNIAPHKPDSSFGAGIVNDLINSHSVREVTVLFGFGTKYDFNEKLSLELSVRRYQKRDEIREVDYIGSGFTYHLA